MSFNFEKKHFFYVKISQINFKLSFKKNDLILI